MAAADNTDSNAPVVLGRVSGVYGVKGWVRLYSYTDPRDAILGYEGLLENRGDDWQAVRVEEGKLHGKGVIARFAGIEDRDQAAAYIGADLAVRRGSLPEPSEGHYYWADLEGLEVVHRDGRVLGRVDYLIETGANDVLVVTGEREVLVPFVIGSVILDVDLSAGRIRVDWEWD